MYKTFTFLSKCTLVDLFGSSNNSFIVLYLKKALVAKYVNKKELIPPILLYKIIVSTNIYYYVNKLYFLME